MLRWRGEGDSYAKDRLHASPLGIFAFSLMAATAGCQEPVTRERLYIVTPAATGLSASVRSVDGRPDVDLFHGDLAPYGQWIDTAEYGLGMDSAAVAPDWRPIPSGSGRTRPTMAGPGPDEPWGWRRITTGPVGVRRTPGMVRVPGREWNRVGSRGARRLHRLGPLPPRRVGGR